MTNTDNAPAAKPNGKKDTTASEPTTVTVVETRRGVGPGILIGAISAALVGGLLLGGGAGALITRTIDLGNRPGLGQLVQIGHNQDDGMPGQLGGGMPGQQNGGMPGQPGGPQQNQVGPGQPPPDQDGDSDLGTGTDDNAG